MFTNAKQTIQKFAPQLATEISDVSEENLIQREAEEICKIFSNVNELTFLQEASLLVPEEGKERFANEIPVNTTQLNKRRPLKSSDNLFRKYQKQYRNQYIFQDLADREDLSMQDRLVPAHLLPLNADPMKTLSSINGREVIKIERLYYERRKLLQNYYFSNGEPVPPNKVTKTLIKTKKLEGRKVISEAGFKKRRYKFPEGRYLERDEIENIIFNNADGKLYLGNLEVIWEEKKKKPDPQIVNPKINPMIERSSSTSLEAADPLNLVGDKLQNSSATQTQTYSEQKKHTFFDKRNAWISINPGSFLKKRR